MADEGRGGQEVCERVRWLEGEACRIIRASLRRMDDGTAAFPPQVGIGYDAFWLRDYEYTLEGAVGAYTDEELVDACRLFIRSMRDDGAGVDCVRFNGAPIYRPGYDTMGEHPVADGSQFTVGVTYHTWRRTGDETLLREVFDPLLRSMAAVPRRPDDGLVFIDPEREWDRCPYGFTDTVRKTGAVLFCSLLYVQACRQLAELLEAGDHEAEAHRLAAESERVAASVREVFWDPGMGLFRAATARCREPDIWGSAFAVYLGVADERQSVAVAECFRAQYERIVQDGQVRHLPDGVYWESAGPRDEYQNGGFWATPTGWFVLTLDLVDPALADRTIADMVDHFRRYGACEWTRGDRRRLPNYLASAALPLDGIRGMLKRRTGRP